MQLTTTLKCMEIKASLLLSMSLYMWRILYIHYCTLHIILLEVCHFFDYHHIPPHHSARKTFPPGYVLRLMCLHVVEMNCVVLISLWLVGKVITPVPLQPGPICKYILISPVLDAPLSLQLQNYWHPSRAKMGDNICASNLNPVLCRKLSLLNKKIVSISNIPCCISPPYFFEVF